jgi:mono/diheme cytochrome c family protein
LRCRLSDRRDRRTVAHCGTAESLLLCLSAVLAIGLLASEARAEAPEPADRSVDFARDVQPIFALHCYRCHGPELQESNYRLDVKQAALGEADFGEPAIVPGKSDESPLIQYVAADDDDFAMPPEGDRLTAEEIAILRAWIDEGAVWPDELAGNAARRGAGHWAFQPVKRILSPNVESDWVTNAIDAFILQRLEGEGLSPASRADRRTLIRRVYLDMHGLPPTPERVAEFVADERLDAYARLIEEVLASPRYGERWAQHWLDVVRYADTHGFEINTPRPNAWPYRDYVIRSLNDDKPYDRFVYEQIAGDRVGVDAATGFLVAAPVLLPGQIGQDEDSKKEARQDELDEVITGVGATMLGLTLNCARCHNHKFDPILQTDYFSLQAVFSGVQYGDRPLRTPQSEAAREQLAQLEADLVAARRELHEAGVRPPVDAALTEEHFEPVTAKYVRFTILDTNLYEPCIDELEIFETAAEGQPPRNVALRSVGAKATASGSRVSEHHQLEYIHDGRYGNTRSWMADVIQNGWVQIELADATRIDRIVWARDREKRYTDRLAIEYRIDVAAEPGEWTTVASSNMRLPQGTQVDEAVATGGTVVNVGPEQRRLLDRLRVLEKQKAALETHSKQFVFAGVMGAPQPTYRLLRGDHRQPRERMKPDTIELLGSLDLDETALDDERRDALARWIASPDNPLTARVIVNRIWHHHFGTGIVATPSDFGRAGEAPSHPELLDWLAGELIDNGWSIKHLHGLILHSSTYRQAGGVANEAAEKVDADVRLLWRFPARRLEAEAIRDSVLQTSGVLNLEMGGPGFDLFKPRQGLDLYYPKDEYGPAEWRRLIYAHKVRMESDGVFSAFDVPDGGQICAKRTRSTTPLQALNLFNSRFMIRQAGLLAERIDREFGEDATVEARVDRAFQLTLTRDPERDEAAAAVELAKEHGLATLCRVLLNTSEFVMLP